MGSLVIKKLKTEKRPLIISFGVVVLIDLISLIIFMIKGTPFKYSQINFYLFLVDALFFVFTIMSNPKFRYYITSLLLYSGLNILLTLIFRAKYYSGTYVVVTDLSAFLFLVFRLASIVLIVVIYLITLNKNKKKYNISSFVVSGLSILAGLVYAIFLFMNGVFGQGFNNRDLIYKGRTVYTFMEGKMNSCYIPDSFNGLTINKIDEQFFLDTISDNGYKNLDSVYIKNSNNIYLDEYTGNPNFTTKIYVKKSEIDSFKNKLWTKNLKQLANNTLINIDSLKENEVYVTFKYDTNYSGQRMTTWFGSKGDILDANDLSLPYGNHYDENNAYDLGWNYDNNNKKILVVNDNNGNTVINTNINNSMVANVEFNKIYRFNVIDNDEIYELDSSNTENYNGMVYITKNTASKYTTNFANSIDNRNGFIYGFMVNGALIDLEDLVNDNVDNFTLKVVYAYAQVELTSTFNKNAYTYGDDIIINNKTTAHNDLNVTYSCINGTVNNSLVTVSKPFAGSNSYTIIATLSSPNSSLTKQLSKTITTNVNKKNVSITWNHNNDSITFDANYHTCTGILKQEQFVSGDISGEISVFNESYRNANSYTLNIDNTFNSLYSNRDSAYKLSDLYNITNKSTVFKILQKSVSVSYSNTTLTYNGQAQLPTPSVTGLIEGDSDNVQLSLSGNNKNKGTYTTIASLNSGNYKITIGGSQNYTINPYPITVTWSNTSLTYNGNNQLPTYVTSASINSEDVKISVSGNRKDAGNGIAYATLGNANYTISTGTSQNFTISPKPISLTWSNTSLTYNGSVQKPSVTSNDVIGNDNLNISISATGKDVGNYNASATVGNTNYTINANGSSSYSITPKTITGTWINKNLTYNGQVQKPSVNFMGICGNDNVNLSVSATGKDVGEYSASCSINNNNYLFSLADTTYNIVAKGLTVTWTNTTFTYDGNSHIPTATLNGVIGTDECEAIVSGEATNAGNYTATITSITNNNYVITSGSTTNFIINKADIDMSTVSWNITNNYEFTFDGDTKTITLNNIPGLVNVEYTNNSGSEVGTYVTYASFTVTNTNYNTPSQMSITWKIVEEGGL